MNEKAHPKSCQECNGTQVVPGRTVTSKAEGRTIIYTTWRPCDHDWWHDEPDLTPVWITIDQAIERLDERASHGDADAFDAYIGLTHFRDRSTLKDIA